MIGRLINLPFRVLGKAARAVQDREDAAQRARHGEGDKTSDLSHIKADAALEVPDDFDPGNYQISSKTVLEDQAKGLPTYFLDVREKQGNKRIADADHVPFSEITIRLAELPPDIRIVVFCGDGRRSKDAARFLRFRGIDDVVHLRGGLTAWTRSGGTVEESESSS